MNLPHNRTDIAALAARFKPSAETVAKTKHKGAALLKAVGKAFTGSGNVYTEEQYQSALFRIQEQFKNFDPNNKEQQLAYESLEQDMEIIEQYALSGDEQAKDIFFKVLGIVTKSDQAMHGNVTSRLFVPLDAKAPRGGPFEDKVAEAYQDYIESLIAKGKLGKALDELEGGFSRIVKGRRLQKRSMLVFFDNFEKFLQDDAFKSRIFRLLESDTLDHRISHQRDPEHKAELGAKLQKAREFMRSTPESLLETIATLDAK